jgi:hypothetical protein
MNPIKLTAVTFVAMFGVAAIVSSANAAGTLPPASTKTGVTYATDIKPILDASCVKCHSGDKPKAKLKLDSLENALKGGKDGKVIIPGNSAKSTLVLAAAHMTSDPDLWMPPKKFEAKFPPLKADQIGLIRAWIDQGAK